VALLHYGSQYGLPRMSTAECAEQLRRIKPLPGAPDWRQRSAPADFAKYNAYMSRPQLMALYRASDHTIGRWRKELSE
jgi:hypothetical protein